MKLEELQVNTPVTIEMTLGGKVYPLGTKVVFNDLRGTMLSAITSDGKLLALGQGVFANATYRMIAAGASLNGREQWSKISVQTVELKTGYAYKVMVNSFNSQSQNANRRENERYPVGLLGEYSPAESGVAFDARIEDVSINGIAFSIKEDLPLEKTHMQIAFSETIDDDAYEVKVGVTCVRKMQKNNRILYGCSIEAAYKDFLVYIAAKQEATKAGPDKPRKPVVAEKQKEPEASKKQPVKSTGYHFIGRK